MAQKGLTKETAQHTQFAAMARELGCDESAAAFDSNLAKVARASVPRKPAVTVKVTKPQRTSKAAPKAPEPGKKKIRFNLPGA